MPRDVTGGERKFHMDYGVLGIVLGLLIAGGLLVSQYVLDARYASRKQAADFVGVPAQARIVGFTSTSLLINNLPLTNITVEVVPAGEPPYLAVIHCALPPAQVAALAPGQTIAVLYDPDNQQNVKIAGTP
jgi:hypothetical protein